MKANIIYGIFLFIILISALTLSDKLYGAEYRPFIGKSINNFKKSKPSKKKGILDDEGDFIDYEEVD